jgi:hypothetical protein
MAIGMALSTAEVPTGTRSVPCIEKQYRLMHRREDGTAQYRSVNDTEGSEMLWVYPDGSTLRHVIVGACSPCEMAEMYADGRPGCGLGDQCPREKSRVHDARWGENCGRCERCLERLVAGLGGPAPADSADSEPASESAQAVPEPEPEPGKDGTVRPFRAFPPRTPGNGNPVSSSKDNAPATPEEAAVQAARQLAIHVWDAGKTVTLQQLSLQVDDPNLLIATALG